MDGKKIRVHVEKQKTAAQANMEKKKYLAASPRSGEDQKPDAREFSDAAGK